MEQLLTSATSATQLGLALLALLVYAFVTRTYDAHLRRKEKLAERDDFMPTLVETLKKLVDRLEKHEEREELVFGAILSKLDGKQTNAYKVYLGDK
jgi:hypothetical protein